MNVEQTLKQFQDWIVESLAIATEFERIAADQLLVETIPDSEKMGRTLANAVAFRTAQNRRERLINEIKGTPKRR